MIELCSETGLFGCAFQITAGIGVGFGAAAITIIFVIALSR